MSHAKLAMPEAPAAYVDPVRLDSSVPPVEQLRPRSSCSSQWVYQFKPSCFASHNTFDCPLKLRRDNFKVRQKESSAEPLPQRQQSDEPQGGTEFNNSTRASPVPEQPPGPVDLHSTAGEAMGGRPSSSLPNDPLVSSIGMRRSTSLAHTKRGYDVEDYVIKEWCPANGFHVVCCDVPLTAKEENNNNKTQSAPSSKASSVNGAPAERTLPREECVDHLRKYIQDFIFSVENDGLQTNTASWLLSQFRVTCPSTLREQLLRSVSDGSRRQAKHCVEQRLEFRPMIPDCIILSFVRNGTDHDGVVEVTVADIKSSSKMKGGHQMQVGFYRRVLIALLNGDAKTGEFSLQRPGMEKRIVGVVRDIGEVWVAPSHGCAPRRETFRITAIDSLIDDFFRFTIPKVVDIEDCGDANPCDEQMSDDMAFSNGIPWTLGKQCLGCDFLFQCKARKQQEKGTTPRRFSVPLDSYQSSDRIDSPSIDKATSGIVTLPPAMDGCISVVVCIDPLDGRFVSGAARVYKGTSNPLTFKMVFDERPPVSRAEEFVSKLSNLMMLLDSAASVKVLVWNFAQKAALLALLDQHQKTHFPFILETTVGNVDVVISPDRLQLLRSTICCVSNIVETLVVCPSSSPWTLGECAFHVGRESSIGGNAGYIFSPVVDKEMTGIVSSSCGAVTHHESLATVAAQLLGANLDGETPFRATHTLEDVLLDERDRPAEQQLVADRVCLLLAHVVCWLHASAPDKLRGPTTPLLRITQGAPHRTNLQSTNLSSSDIVRLLQRVTLYDTCAALTDRHTTQETRPVILRYEPSLAPVDDFDDVRCLFLRFKVLPQDGGDAISRLNVSALKDFSPSGSSQKQLKPSTMTLGYVARHPTIDDTFEMRQVRSDDVVVGRQLDSCCAVADELDVLSGMAALGLGKSTTLRTAVQPSTGPTNDQLAPPTWQMRGNDDRVCEGSWWCKAVSFAGKAGAKDTWTPVDLHPDFRSEGLGEYVMVQNSLSTSSYLQCDNYCQMSPDLDDGQLCCDIVRIEASNDVVYLKRHAPQFGGARAKHRCQPSPREEFLLFPRFVDFNVSKVTRVLTFLSENAEYLDTSLLNFMAGRTATSIVNNSDGLFSDSQRAEVARIAPPLNRSQEEFYRHTLDSRLSLLWGPPGTGKTHALANTIARWCTARPTNDPIKILCVAFSNAALDVLHEATTSAIGQYRSAAGTSTSPTAVYRVPRDKVTQTKIRESSDNCVVFSTVWNAFKIFLEGTKQKVKVVKPKEDLFDVLVVDEASQMPASHSLIPSLLLKNRNKVIVAGDLLQLSPIMSETIGQQATADELPFCGSVFQALLRSRDSNTQLILLSDMTRHSWRNLCRLTTSHRSISAIAGLVGTLYGGLDSTLATETEGKAFDEDCRVQKRTVINRSSALDELCFYPLVVLQADVHVVEAQVVKTVVDRYAQVSRSRPTSRGPLSVLVITPHRRQRDACRIALQPLAQYDPQGSIQLKINTVDSMQGTTADVVVLALHAVQATDFVYNLTRLNVALSRARFRVVVVTNVEVIRPSPSIMGNHGARAAHELLQEFLTRSKVIHYT